MIGPRPVSRRFLRDDPDGEVFGLPTYTWLSAPEGLATRRQLRALGLRPGGQEVAAQVLWFHRQTLREAHLYRVAAAKPAMRRTAAQIAAMREANRRRQCAAAARHGVDLAELEAIGDPGPQWHTPGSELAPVNPLRPAAGMDGR